MEEVRIQIPEGDGEGAPGPSRTVRVLRPDGAVGRPAAAADPDIVGVVRVAQSVLLPGGVVHRGRVWASQPEADSGDAGRSGRLRCLDAWWAVPGASVVSELAGRGRDLAEAADGLGRAMRTLSGLHTSTPDVDVRIGGGGAVRARRGIARGSVFLLAPAAEVEALARSARDLLADAWELLRACDCHRGCSACSGGGARAREGRPVPDRRAAMALAGGLLGVGEPGAFGRDLIRRISPA